jgi:hypothetical protein
MKYKIVVFDEAYILYHFKIIAFLMLHNSTKDFQLLKEKAILSFETSENGNPATQIQITENWNPTLHPCENPKTHTDNLLSVSLKYRVVTYRRHVGPQDRANR